MKVTVPRRNNNNNTNHGFAPPPIPLEKPEVKELEKDQYLALKLKSIPNRANSAEYTLNVPYFQSGTPEEWLKFLQNLERVFVGQNLTTGPNKFSMARRLLAGDSLSHFDRKAETLVNGDNNVVESEANFKLAIRAVTETILNRKALLTQKRYMRRILRKPKGMTIRMYCARFSELNKYLESFPPYNENQKLPDDELLEHFEFAIPNAWQKQMVLQGFNTLEHTTEEFVEFCEQLEFSKDFIVQPNNGQKATTRTGVRNTGSRQSAAKTPSKRKLDKFCLYHGMNSTHVSDECRVLIDQAEKLAQSHKNVGSGKYARNHEKNHEKPQKSNSDKKKTMQSFKTEIVKEVVEFFNKQGARGNKKRRVMNMEEFNMEEFRDLSVSDDEDSHNDSSDDSENEE